MIPATTQELWALLHRDHRGSPALLRYVRQALPCDDCVHHFDAFVRQYPPLYGRWWFSWTVALHNDVNARLGRHRWSLAEAARFWGRLM